MDRGGEAAGRGGSAMCRVTVRGALAGETWYWQLTTEGRRDHVTVVRPYRATRKKSFPVGRVGKKNGQSGGRNFCFP